MQWLSAHSCFFFVIFDRGAECCSEDTKNVPVVYILGGGCSWSQHSRTHTDALIRLGCLCSMSNDTQKDLPTARDLKVAVSQNQQSEPVLEEVTGCH